MCLLLWAGAGCGFGESSWIPSRFASFSDLGAALARAGSVWHCQLHGVWYSTPCIVAVHMGVAWLSAALALSIAGNASAKLDPGRTPPMGWRSWCVSEFPTRMILS